MKRKSYHIEQFTRGAAYRVNTSYIGGGWYGGKYETIVCPADCWDDVYMVRTDSKKQARRNHRAALAMFAGRA